MWSLIWPNKEPDKATVLQAWTYTPGHNTWVRHWYSGLLNICPFVVIDSLRKAVQGKFLWLHIVRFHPYSLQLWGRSKETGQYYLMCDMLLSSSEAPKLQYISEFSLLVRSNVYILSRLHVKLQKRFIKGFLNREGGVCSESTRQKHDSIGVIYPCSVSASRNGMWNVLRRARKDVSMNTHRPGIFLFFFLKQGPDTLPIR